MKRLNDYIKNIDKLQPSHKFSNEHLHNLNLNYVSNDVKKFINIKNIFEHLHITVNEQPLLEGSGLYKGCYELAKYIDQKVFNSNESKIIIKTNKLKFQNIFTKEIILNINRHSSEEYAGYVFANKLNCNYNEDRWLEKENLFKFIEIELDFSNKTKSVIDLIIHELDHAYDDYIQYKNNGTTYQYKYIKSNYKIFDKHKGDDEFTELVRAINYIFIKFETHAYISQINGEINKTFNNISEAYDFIEKNSNTWKQLKIVKNNAEYILQNKEYSNNYCEVYKSITNTQKSNIKIIKELENNLNKYWKKVINHVYLLLVENSISENKITTIPSSRQFIKEIKKV